MTSAEESQVPYSESELIPKERYISRAWLELERERLWPRVWQMACRLEEIPEVGDYLEYKIADQSILLVRETPDVVKAYHNACLHRGTRLGTGAGNTGEEIVCPFHGWAWNLDGSILEVPDADDFAPECVVRADLHLPEVQVDSWGGFVFVSMAEDPEPLLEFLAPIPERLAPFEVDKMRLLRYRTTIMECNWKAGLDAFNEVYHIEATHIWDMSGYAGGAGATFKARFGGTQEKRFNSRDVEGRTPGSTMYEYEVFENHNLLRNRRDNVETSVPLGEMGDPRESAIAILELQEKISMAHQDDVDYVRKLPEVPGDVPSLKFLTDVRRAVGHAGGIDYSAIPDGDMASNIDFGIYPNLVGPINAGNWVLFRFRPNGDDPDTCIFDAIFLHRFPEGEEPPLVEHQWFPSWRDHDDWGVIGQDLSNMGLVQAGMHQSSFAGLRLNRQEAGIRNHHRFLDRYMA